MSNSRGHGNKSSLWFDFHVDGDREKKLGITQNDRERDTRWITQKSSSWSWSSWDRLLRQAVSGCWPDRQDPEERTDDDGETSRWLLKFKWILNIYTQRRRLLSSPRVLWTNAKKITKYLQTNNLRHMVLSCYLQHSLHLWKSTTCRVSYAWMKKTGLLNFIKLCAEEDDGYNWTLCL